LVWASSGDLAPGQIITESDLTPASVLLAQSAKNYLSASAQIVGTTVLTKISAGDLIPVAAIATGLNAENQRLVPLTIEISDLPIALSRGDVVDIYAIAKINAKASIPPTLLVSAVSVEQVLERSNSGVVSLLVILENEQVISTLNYLSDCRLIIVRNR
jgi:hypothetical protein